MASFSEEIAAGADDGYARSGTFFDWLDWVLIQYYFGVWDIWLRWDNFPPGGGATISAATIDFIYRSHSQSDDPEADLVTAGRLGMRTAFVLSGKHADHGVLARLEQEDWPDIVCASLADIDPQALARDKPGNGGPEEGR